VAISFSRPDPSSPASVADATFGTARRGFDQQEVRDFLRMVAAELARLQERERFLERELRAAQAAPVSTEGIALDDDTATRLLGEEAARVLQAAREGGAAIRARAEDGAAQLLREAGDEARRLREEAELEASRRRSDAAADAEAELAMAKQQGREMVEEARAYRERVLGELSRRRELARQQIEQLVHGRDRLLQAFERARLVAVDVVAELTPLGGPDEYVDLTPTTGPVPIMVPAANLGDTSSVDDDVLRRPTGDAATAPDEDVDEAEAELEAFPAEDAGEPEAAEAEPDTADEGVDDLEAEEATEAPASATVVPFPAQADIEPAEPAERAEPAEPDAVDDPATSDVDALFAKLRANPPVEADVEIDDEAEAEAPGDETPFGRRDAALVPLIVAAARKLKRVLADEQNDVLDTLRRKEPVRDLDTLLPDLGAQAARYTDAITVELISAAEVGAASTGADAAIDLGPDGPLAAVRELLATDLVEPLRERLERSVVEGDGVNDAITKRARSVYREWKTQHIDEQLDDVFRLAYCQGAFAALGSGTLVTWEVDPDGPPSPDCEDNNLAGAVPAGEAFPSGHVSPPMHPGCRCLLLRADR
jgi:DivIVA domain-containing protein